MKKIMDAVNEFKGEFRSSKSFALLSLTDNECAKKGEIKFGSSGFDDIHFSFICNELEYIGLVSQLETNFGESLSYKEYVSVQAMGASMVGKPPQPVFTQAMADNGELPPIGSEFIDIELNDIGDNTTVLAIAHDLKLKRVVYRRGSTLDDSEYFGAVAHECKPIDTRTDKEKAASEFVKDMTDSDFIKGQFEKAFLAGVKWVGE